MSQLLASERARRACPALASSAMPDGTRVRAGLVGQATGFMLLRVDLAADDAAIRADFLTKAAEKLGVPLPDDVSAVRGGCWSV